LQCVANNSDAGGLVGAGVGGAAAIGAGAPLLPYSWFGPALSGGGASGGTSVISAAARGFLGKGFFSGGDFVNSESGWGWSTLSSLEGTGSKAALVGRVASKAFVVVGVGLEAYGGYKVYKAYQACTAQSGG